MILYDPKSDHVPRVVQSLRTEGNVGPRVAVLKVVWIKRERECWRGG